MGLKHAIEVLVFLTYVSFMLTGSVYTNLVIFRTCYTILGYNETECAILGSPGNHSEEIQKLEKLVEPEAAIVNTVRSTLESVFTSIICLFIGPWSDRFGRKPVLILSLLGFSLGYLLMAVFSIIPNLSPWYTIICSIPLILTGGGPTFLTTIVSYIADVSNDDERGTSMAIFEAVLVAGILIGNLVSPYLFYATNYASVFTIAAACCTLALIYTIYFVPESVEHVETEGRLRGLFQMTNLINMFKTVGKERDNYNRSILLMSIAILTIYIFIINGDSAVTFLFLRSKFDWSLTQYQLFSSASNVLWIFGTVFGTYFLHKFLQVTESVLVFMGILCMLNSMLLQGLATKNWHIYASTVVKFLGGTISPMMRSLVSKTVLAEEIGKIFAAIMASEFFFSLGAPPLYTLVYNKTISKDPALFNFMSAGFYGVTIVLILIIMYVQFKSPVTYVELNDETTLDDEDRQHAIN